MYEIRLTAQAEKNLKKFDRELKRRVAQTLTDLSANPRPSGCRRVITEPCVWRVRVGDWLIGYEIDDALGMVKVIRIVQRRDFYS